MHNQAKHKASVRVSRAPAKVRSSTLRTVALGFCGCLLAAVVALTALFATNTQFAKDATPKVATAPSGGSSSIEGPQPVPLVGASHVNIVSTSLGIIRAASKINPPAISCQGSVCNDPPRGLHARGRPVPARLGRPRSVWCGHIATQPAPMACRRQTDHFSGARQTSYRAAMIRCALARFGSVLLAHGAAAEPISIDALLCDTPKQVEDFAEVLLGAQLSADEALDYDKPRLRGGRVCVCPGAR